MEPGQSAYPDEAHADSVEQSAGNRDVVSGVQSIFPGLEELRDLPQRILPEETYAHLQNAGREALLAVYSLWRSIDTARKGPAGAKVRKHIDVE